MIRRPLELILLFKIWSFKLWRNGVLLVVSFNGQPLNAQTSDRRRRANLDANFSQQQIVYKKSAGSSLKVRKIWLRTIKLELLR